MIHFLKSRWWAIGAIVMLVVIEIALLLSGAVPVARAETKTPIVCSADNGGITLPPGFCATIFADDIGHARHMAVDAKGVVYVNTWSGKYYDSLKQLMGGMVV
ncbi:MAG: glucose dehydrogenase, partial [Pseudomonadota bacterium]|nr:glucose dehydrogenase [Pseudomonadota bacterium]